MIFIRIIRGYRNSKKLTWKFIVIHSGAHRCFRDSGVQVLRAAPKPSGSRDQNSYKRKIKILVISCSEDLSQHLISLGCGSSCWLFKIKFAKYISPNLICSSILIRALPCKIYYNYKTITRAKVQKNRAITITSRSMERQCSIMEREV